MTFITFPKLLILLLIQVTQQAIDLFELRSLADLQQNV